MRLRELALCAVLCLHPALQAAPVTPEQVQQAVETVKRHPDLGGTVTKKTLRWKNRDEPHPDGGGSQLKWLVELAAWLSETSRALMWLAGATLVALLLVGLRRWVRVRGGFTPAARAVLPSHVQDLDIRPDSLPTAIGASAATLWQRGEARSALALLYRGALSRLVHTHAVPIRAASTEEECLALARVRLEPAPGAYLARLVQAWQLAVYGGRLPSAEEALALFEAFDRQLQAPPEARA